MLSRKLLFLIPLVLLSLLYSSCRCTDSGSVAVTEDDDSFPELIWVVTHATTDSEGHMISSQTLYTGDENIISAGINERITVVLKAKDEQSGIKYLELKGGYGFTCLHGTTAQIVDGVTPEDSKNLSPTSGCAKIEASLDPIVLPFALCDSPYTFSSGSYILTGIAHNHAELEILSRLTINVTP